MFTPDRETHHDCCDLLMDVVCYEILSRRMSPEMQKIVERHVAGCCSCNLRFHDFTDLLGAGPPQDSWRVH